MSAADSDMTAEQTHFLEEHGGLPAEVWSGHRLGPHTDTLSVDDAAARLGADPAVISQWLAQGEVAGWAQGAQVRLPAWQFTQSGLLPHLAEMLAALPAAFPRRRCVASLRRRRRPGREVGRRMARRGRRHRSSGIRGLGAGLVVSLPAPAERHQVSLPAVTCQDVRARVGSRGFSAYVADAVIRQLERDALDDALARMDAAHGPADEDEIAAIMRRVAD